MIILQNEYPSISIRFILKITVPFGDVYLNALDNKLRIAELIFSTSIHSSQFATLLYFSIKGRLTHIQLLRQHFYIKVLIRQISFYDVKNCLLYTSSEVGLRGVGPSILVVQFDTVELSDEVIPQPLPAG